MLLLLFSVYLLICVSFGESPTSSTNKTHLVSLLILLFLFSHWKWRQLYSHTISNWFSRTIQFLTVVVMAIYAGNKKQQVYYIVCELWRFWKNWSNNNSRGLLHKIVGGWCSSSSMCCVFILAGLYLNSPNRTEAIIRLLKRIIVREGVHLPLLVVRCLILNCWSLASLWSRIHSAVANCIV